MQPGDHISDRVSRRRYEREKRARQEAEELLEARSRELFYANEALQKQASALEKAVQERTQDLEAARLEAERANEAKSSFLAVMSHEIRTPLNGVLGMAMVLAESQVNREQREALDVIMSSGNMLLTIINDILDLSKVEAGKLEMEVQPTSIDMLLKSLVQQYQPQVQELGLEFLCSKEGALGRDDLWVELDPTRIRQVLGNLLSNAMKFTEKGRVSLVADALELPDGQVRLLFSVRDTGVGIPQDQQKNLFKPFSQANAGITRKYGGTGLGLVVSQNICRTFSGGITFESEQGVGSCFFVELNVPAATAPPDTRQEWISRDEAVMRRRKWRVLVAEDNKTNQLVLKHMLKGFELDLIMVADGAAALDYWRMNQVDLILMDVNMPVMDGITAAAQIREAEVTLDQKPVPILAVSANAMLHQVSGYLSQGMTGHVAKPIRRTELVAAMAKALDA